MKLLLFGLLILFAPALGAQEYIEITGAHNTLVSIAPGEGAEDPLAKEVLRLLNWSGIFDLHQQEDASDLSLTYVEYPEVAKLEIHGTEGLVFYSAAIPMPLLGADDEAKTQAKQIIRTLTGEQAKLNSAIVYVTNSPTEGHKLVMTDFWGMKQKTLSGDGKVVLLPRWNRASTAVTYTYLALHGAQVKVFSLSGEIETIRPKLGSPLESVFSDHPDTLMLSLSVRGNSDLYGYNRRSHQLKRYTFRSSLEASPTFSPTGDKLLFISDRSGTVQIYQKDLITQETWRMTFVGKYNAEPAWSPPGKFFAFSGLVNGQYQVFLMDSLGRRQQQLTFSRGSNEQPRFSPDGRQIVYVHKERGVQKLYLMRTDGSFNRRLTDSAPHIQEYNPDWSLNEITW